jgi:hypothetical protein
VSETECPLTELPPSQCACPKHRGGHAPGDEPTEIEGRPFEAQYSGTCADCGDPIERGDRIGFTGRGYVHAPRCP